MSSIVVRNLDPLVKDALTERARERGRSLQAEVRDILTRASQQRRYANLGPAFLAVGKENGGWRSCRCRHERMWHGLPTPSDPGIPAIINPWD